MSTRSTSEGSSGRQFVLAPNIAPDWGQTMRIFAGLSAVCLGIALVCTWMGFWPVLPFAGLELTALGVALYTSARRSLDREIIHVDGNAVRVEKGRGRVERAWDLNRAWTEVVLRRLPRRWEETQLLLRSRGQELIIGDFLEAEERRSLARELGRCIGPMARCGDDGIVSATAADEAQAAPSVGPSHSLGDRTG